jgi:hypothetical protein
MCVCRGLLEGDVGGGIDWVIEIHFGRLAERV